MKNQTVKIEKLTKQQYVDERLKKLTCLWVKTLTILAPVFFFSHGFMNYFLNPGVTAEFNSGCIVTSVVLLIIHLFTKLKQDRIFQYQLAFAATVASAVAVELMVMSSGGHLSGSYVGLNLLVITVLGLIPFTIFWSVITAGTVYLVYLVPILLYDEITGLSVFVESNIFIIATFSIAVVWRAKNQRNMIKEFELRYELAEDENGIKNNIRRLNSAFDMFSHIAEEVEKQKGFDVSSYKPIENSNLPACWEVKNCDKKECPVYGHKNLRCWQVAGTHCSGEVQGKFARKIGACKKCEVYKSATGDEVLELVETFNNMMHMLESSHRDLREAHKTAKEASKHKSEFLANMSHEIRTPMNAILGMSSLMQSTELSDEQSDYVDTLQKSAFDLLNLINDILDFSKIEAGKLSLDIVDFNLRVVVEGVADTLAPQASEKGLELACLFQDNVPTLLRGDPTRIHQTLLNFGSNAVKFTDEGEVFICIELKEETEHDAEITISVIDTGVGIPEEKQKMIFEEFTQADGSTTRLYGGTGLGLSISSKLVKMMGGEIGVASELGKGSRFWFSTRLEKQEKGQHNVMANIHSSVKGMRVLVADDNHTNRKILKKMLENFGCNVESASSGAGAIKMLKSSALAEKPYRLLLLDMMMPGMNGEHTTIIIKNTPEIRNVTIVVLTSIGGVSGASHMKDIGCDGYLVKPVKQSLLLDTITTVISDRYETANISTEEVAGGFVIDESSLKNVHILLVEDHPVNQKTATIMLKKAGYEVDIAGNGRVAVKMVEEKDYDLVLMDIQMPEMDGYEATAVIRENDGAGKHTIIIAMTAHSMQGDREKCIDAGMDDYLSKPINPTEMFRVIEKWAGIEKDSPDVDTAREESLSDEGDEFVLHNEGNAAEHPVNLKNAMTRFGNDKVFYKEMVSEFLNYVPEQISILEDATRGDDAEKVQVNAHGIKGAAGNLSAKKLYDIAVHIEEMGRSGNISGVAPMISDLKSEVSSLKDFVAEL